MKTVGRVVNTRPILFSVPYEHDPMQSKRLPLQALGLLFSLYKEAEAHAGKFQGQARNPGSLSPEHRL